LLSEYLSKGGYPDIIFNNVEYDKFFKEYLDVLIFRDIVERGNVRNISAIRFLMNCDSYLLCKGVFNTQKLLYVKEHGYEGKQKNSLCVYYIF